MIFASPIWLIGLLPWLAVVAWVLRGQGTPVSVPFLDLWRGPVMREPTRRRWRLPGLAVAAVLAGALFALLAAARPSVTRAQTSSPDPIRILVDRGITMSGPTPTRPLFHALAAELERRLVDQAPDRRLRVEFVPPAEPMSIRADELSRAVRAVPPTAVDTAPLLPDLLRSPTSGADGEPTIVISNLRLPDPLPPRTVQVAPDALLPNVGIASVAARLVPRPQLMVTLVRTSTQIGAGDGGNDERDARDVRADDGTDRRDADEAPVALRVKCGGTTMREEVSWPPSAGRRYTVFIDLPRDVGEVIEVELERPDDIAADNRAWLALERVPPSIAARTTVPPSLQRMIDAYARVRPGAGEGAGRIAIVAEVADAPRGEPSVIRAPSAESPQEVVGEMSVAEHPVTSNVNWPALAGAMRLASPPPSGAGFRAVVQIGDRPAVAVSADPVRRVWVGFDVEGWERTPDFVIFWTNVFDWLGGDESAAYRAEFVGPRPHAWLTTAEPGLDQVDPGLWPGLYQGEDGTFVAVNAVPSTAELTRSMGGADPLLEVLAGDGRSAPASLAPGLALLAAACALLAATVWPDTT